MKIEAHTPELRDDISNYLKEAASKDSGITIRGEHATIEIMYEKHNNFRACVERAVNGENEVALIADLCYIHEMEDDAHKHYINHLKGLLKKCRDQLVLCSLIDKSGQCSELVDKVDLEMGWNKNSNTEEK